MANLIASYDLNGPHPTHHEMDKHLEALGPNFLRARILETLWYIAGPITAAQLLQYIQRIASPNDLVFVAEATSAAWTKLLVNGDQFKRAFESQPQSNMTRKRSA